MSIIVEWELGTGNQSFQLGKQVIQAPDHLVKEAKESGSDIKLKNWLSANFDWSVLHWSVFNDNTEQHIRI